MSGAVTLLIVEAVARALVPPFTMDALLQPSADAALVVEPRPGASLVFEGLTVAIPPSNVHIAASGVRAPAPASAAPAPGVQRLLCLGDSVVFGWGVDDEQAFCPLLAARLGPGWEAVNLGVPSYNLAQTARRLQTGGLAWGPRRAVLLINANDLDTVVDPLAAGWWVRHSALVRWVASRLARKAAAESLGQGGRDEQAGLEALASIRTYLAAWGVQLQVVLTAPPEPALRAALAGLDVLDASDVLRNPQWVIAGDGHPNAAGHRELADRLAAALRAGRRDPAD